MRGPAFSLIQHYQIQFAVRSRSLKLCLWNLHLLTSGQPELRDLSSGVIQFSFQRGRERKTNNTRIECDDELAAF